MSKAEEVIAKVDALKARVERQRLQLEACREENSDLRSQVGKKREIESELVSTKAELKKAKEAAGSAQQDSARYKAALVGAQAEVSSLQDRLEKFEASARADRELDEILGR